MRYNTVSLKDHVKHLSSVHPLPLNHYRRCGERMLMKESQELGLHWSDWYGGTAERYDRPVQCGDIVDFMIPNNRVRCPGRVETEPGVR